MLDIKFIRENSDVVKKNFEKRKDFDKIKWVDELINLDKKWCLLKQKIDGLRHNRNVVTEEIMELRKAGRNASQKINEAKEIPEKEMVRPRHYFL